MSDTIEVEGGSLDLSAEEQALFDGQDRSSGPAEQAESGGTVETKPEAAAKPEGEKADKVEKMVSLSALHEERRMRQERDTALKAKDLELAELRGKFAVLDRIAGPKPEPIKGPPTAEEDIFGAVKHTGETVAQLQKRLDDQDKAAKEASAAETERNQFVNKYRADAATFEATTPDYMAGYKFLLDSRARELTRMGYDTPEALHNALNADEMAIANMAFSKGKSAAEMIYALAQERGYKAGGAAEDIGKGAAKLDTIARGQQANKTLNAIGGSSGEVEMTAERLEKMSTEDFTVWCEKNPAKAKRIYGG